jgi:alpha-L-arabinofuranosidase
MKKIFSILALLISFALYVNAQAQATSKVTIDASQLQYKINKDIYGQFSEDLGHCIYGGIWVGTNSPIPNIDGIRKDVVEALRKIKVPVLRWPGGCFADGYHWKDGIGPRDKRPHTINVNWGGVTDNNEFGTAEFLEFCKLIGCQPYFTANLGSGTVKEFSQWVEYVNSNQPSYITDLRKRNGHDKPWGVKYWGLGNESWGCGGQMTPEYYSDLVRRYGNFCRDYGDNKVFKIAVGPGGDDYNWTDVVMKNTGSYIDGLSLHYYSFANDKPAADFNEKGWTDIMNKSLIMKELIEKNSAIMDKYDPDKRVALVVDEWGTWYKVEPGTNPAFLYQQNTMRDAVAAAMNLNIFNNHCDRVRMANIAQMVNVLQSMILTKGDKIVLTPTYYVYDLYKVDQNAMWLPTKVESANYVYGKDTLAAVNCSASVDSNQIVHLSLVNINPDSNEKVSVDMVKFKASEADGKILTANKMNAENTFDNPNVVVPKKFLDFKLADNQLEVNMPPMSVIMLDLKGKLSTEIGAGVELNNPQSGVEYKYYEGNFKRLPNFDTLKTIRQGVIDEVSIPKENSDQNFAVQYNGYIKIPADGVYTFYTNSDDGSKLYVDNRLIVSNDGNHAPQEHSGIIVLKAGYHHFRITFYQAGGGMALDASIKGPTLKKQAINADMLFHKE